MTDIGDCEECGTMDVELTFVFDPSGGTPIGLCDECRVDLAVDDNATTCDVSHCGNVPAWVHVGESGDLYVCAEHFRLDGADGWVPYEAEREARWGFR